MAKQRSIEAVYGVPEETPLVMLFERGSGPQFGEIRYVERTLMIELFAERTVLVPAHEIAKVIQLARETLRPPFSARRRLSVDEYLDIERAAETKSEFYDGEMFAMAGASEPHNLISLNIGAELRAALRQRGCRVYPSDMRVKCPTGLYTYPDVTVVCSEPRFEGSKRDNLLNPLVIVEVLSPSTEAYDRGKKFEHYRTIPSLQAYVLVASDRRSVEHFARQDQGGWLLSEPIDGTIAISALDCALSLDEIYDLVELPADDAEAAPSDEPGPPR
jgi:Uma2 family endonuclease